MVTRRVNDELLASLNQTCRLERLIFEGSDLDTVIDVPPQGRHRTTVPCKSGLGDGLAVWAGTKGWARPRFQNISTFFLIFLNVKNFCVVFCPENTVKKR